MAGLYAADGSINVSVVDGTAYTGLLAANGSWNVVQSNGSTNHGVQHACGARWATVVSSGPGRYYAADGSMNVSVSPYIEGTQKVTVVSGAFV